MKERRLVALIETLHHQPRPTPVLGVYNISGKVIENQPTQTNRDQSRILADEQQLQFFTFMLGDKGVRILSIEY